MATTIEILLKHKYIVAALILLARTIARKLNIDTHAPMSDIAQRLKISRAYVYEVADLVVGNLNEIANKTRGRPPNRVPKVQTPHGMSIEDQWMLKILQGKLKRNRLKNDLKGRIDPDDVDTLVRSVLDGSLRYRNRGITVLAYLNSIPIRRIREFLMLNRRTVEDYIKRFEISGIKELLVSCRKSTEKHTGSKYVDAFFEILHAPPSSHGINRTTWRMEDIRHIMKQQGLGISKDDIRRIIKTAGYRFLKAKKVLTSTDPHYQCKLQNITNILSNLGPKEKFFSIDEFGPFAVKMIGGRSLVPKGHVKVIPQHQKSKGRIIITGALELSTNQVTHFYSDHKNTAEMIKLLEVLLHKYSSEECIYLSWDAASWHASKEFYMRVDEINNSENRNKQSIPFVKLAPLPSGAQFLNVIESVFSGMARAIIHNSDYQSVEECKAAIDRHFLERNQHFKENPKRAGNKIWGKERTPAIFSASNNCKDPRYQNLRR